MNLCKYKNLFGELGTGIHSFRIEGIAILDVGVTIIVALFISVIFHWKFIYTLIGLFILGIFIHRIFCVRTTIDQILFPNN
jgi:hypothetical protein